MENVTVDGNYTLVLSDSLLHNPRLNFYQAIYGSALICVTIFAVVKSFVYMKVSERFWICVFCFLAYFCSATSPFATLKLTPFDHW